MRNERKEREEAVRERLTDEAIGDFELSRGREATEAEVQAIEYSISPELVAAEVACWSEYNREAWEDRQWLAQA